MRSSSNYYLPINRLEVYLMRVVDASKSASDESQQDLLYLCAKIPKNENNIHEVRLLFKSLESFKKNPSYNPAILEQAKKALEKLAHDE